MLPTHTKAVVLKNYGEAPQSLAVEDLSLPLEFRADPDQNGGVADWPCLIAILGSVSGIVMTDGNKWLMMNAAPESLTQENCIQLVAYSVRRFGHQGFDVFYSVAKEKR